MLEKGRRGNAAQLEMLLVDPLLFARDPLQGLANAARSRQVSDERHGGRRQVGCHLLLSLAHGPRVAVAGGFQPRFQPATTAFEPARLFTDSKDTSARQPTLPPGGPL